MKEIHEEKRKRYIEPNVEEVQLVAEEAVLQVCKADNGGPITKSNGRCGGNFMCLNIGS